MKAIAEFTKTTLVGGLLVVLPVYFTLLLLAKTVMGMMAVLAPLTAPIPAAVHMRGLLAALMLLAVCFLTGLLVRTGLGQRVRNAIDRNLLEKIPGYSLIRSLAGRVAGAQDDSTFAVALVEIEDALVPAFIVEELDDGEFTVFVPSVPTPAAGSIYILPASRVHKVDVPFTTGVSVISRWGAGAGELRRVLKTQREAARQ